MKLKNNNDKKTYIINHIQERTKLLGRVPKTKELEIDKKEIIKEFDTYKNALYYADIDKDKLVKEKILKELKDYYIKHNKVPKIKDLKDIVDYKVLYTHFKGLDYALKELGLSCNFSKESIIESVELKTKELNRIPTLEEMEGIISHTTFYDYFEGYDEVKNIVSKNLGMEIKHHSFIDKEEIIKIIQDKYKELGRTPKCKELKGLVSDITIKRRFGSYKNAILESKLDYQEIKKKEIEEIILNMYEESGVKPTWKDLKGIVSQSFIYREYGSLNELYEKIKII